MYRRIQTLCLAGALFATVVNNAWAQQAPIVSATSPSILKQMFNAAWARQPEAQSLEVRRDAATARRQSADSWTAEPPSLELSSKSDQLNKNQGIREYTAGIAIPLWLPGERARTGVLADAELRATASRALAAQLRTAASVREAYWLWQRARIENELAQARFANAQKLAVDVAKRVKAGDMARADQHQADGAAATAEAMLAESKSALAIATQRLRSLIGAIPNDSASGAAINMEPLPTGSASLPAHHPAANALLDRADVARRSAELAGTQTRANPELTLGTTRERSISGEPYQQSITLGIRIPFGSDSRNRTKVATARAEAIEAESQLTLEREKLASELDAAKARLDSAKTQLAAAEKRSQLAKESRGFFEKSFRLGETDLPTRLRVELEASEAERQAAIARIELAAAVSALRQSLGILPE